MSIDRTKKGLWRAIIRIRINGETVERAVTAQTKEALKLAIEQKKQEMRTGAPEGSLTAQTEVSTFGQIIDIYKNKRGALSPSHMQKIDFLHRELGHIFIDGFADRFEMWLKLESKATRNKNGGIVKKIAGPAKINRIVEIVRASFNIAVAVGIVDRSPITKERFPKQKETAKDATLTAEQEEKLLKFIDSERPHLSHIARYALRVPARKSELVNLRVDDVDLINQRIRIKNDQSKTNRGMYKPIPPELLLYFRTLPKDTEFVFFRRDENGKAVCLGEFSRSFKYCLKKAGITGITFHSTRHISATRMIDNGTPAQAVQQIAGWTTDMLKTYYARQPGHAIAQVKWGSEVVMCEGVAKVIKC